MKGFSSNPITLELGASGIQYREFLLITIGPRDVRKLGQCDDAPTILATHLVLFVKIVRGE